jgi:hypothetical protein
MKSATLTLVIIALMTLFGVQKSNGCNPISLEAETAMSTKELRGTNSAVKTQETKIGRIFSKIKKGTQKLMFSDPVEKWIWYCVYGAMIAVMLVAIGIVSILFVPEWLSVTMVSVGLAAAVFSLISFIVWIFKLAERKKKD